MHVRICFGDRLGRGEIQNEVQEAALILSICVPLTYYLLRIEVARGEKLRGVSFNDFFF